MFEGIDSYNLKKKFSDLNSNVLNISDALQNLQPKDQRSGVGSIELPDRPIDSLLLFLQTPMNMEKYLVVHSDLIRSRKMHIIDNDIMNKYAELKKSNLNYLFSWDEISGKDSGRFMEFLKQKYSIVKITNIEKSVDVKTIKFETSELSLSLNNEKTKMSIKFADGKTDDFMVKDENGKLNIYKKSFSETEIPELLIFNNLSDVEKKELSKQLSFKIKRFTEFLRAFSVVDEDIKPIMLYYSINYFLTFLSDSLLHFRGRVYHHGLSGTKDLIIKKRGTFARIVDGFFALEKPTIFSPWREGLNNFDYMVKGIIADKGTDKYRNTKNEFTKHIDEVKTLYELYEYTKSPQLSLSDLIRARFILYKHWNKSSSICRISYENLILVDYLVLFIAGSIARYNPTEWTKIQNAPKEECEKIRYHINAAQTNMLNEWIPYLISEHVLPLELINKLEVS